MNGFTKLFGSILDSSVWRESKETRLVWVTMLAMADRDGEINASIPGLADRAKVSLDECLEALKIFQSEDKWSRSPEHGGRRIEVIGGGWRILNHASYRNKMSAEDMAEKNRIRQARFRARKLTATQPAPRSPRRRKSQPPPGPNLIVSGLVTDTETLGQMVGEYVEDNGAEDLPPDERRQRVLEKVANEEAACERVRAKMNPKYA